MTALSTRKVQKVGKTQDNRHEDSLLETLKNFSVFSDGQNVTLQNFATKDLATPEIQQSLLNAQALGQSQLNSFVEDRMISNNQQNFHDPIRKNNAPTMATLYEVKKTKSALTNKNS